MKIRNRILGSLLLITSISGWASEDESELIAPTVIFHAGAKRHLMEDIQAHNVPQQAWDKFIMGGTTDWDLPGYRRGLYGMEYAGATSSYGLDTLKKGEKNWIMAIVIKPECRNRKRMDYAAFFWDDTPRARKVTPFADWIEKNHAQYSDAVTSCQGKEGDFTTWVSTPYFGISAKPPETQKLIRDCSKVIEAYFNSEHKDLIVDQGHREGSWYIRDRNCIADIKGTPDDLFQMIFRNQLGEPSIADSAFLGDTPDPAFEPLAQVVLLMQVLAETRHLKSANVPLMRKWLKSLDNEVTFGDLETTIREKQGFGQTHSVFAIQEIMKSTIACVQHRKVPQLQAALSKATDQFVENIHGPYEKLKTMKPDELFYQWNETQFMADLFRQLKTICGG